MAKNEKCKALATAITTNGNSKLPSKHQISYFLTIIFSASNKSRAHSEPSTKVRIKIPKLLAKTLKKKEQKQSDENNPNVRKPLLEKVTTLLSDAFGRKKKTLVENYSDITFVLENKNSDDEHTDETLFHEKCVSENAKLFASTTASLSSNGNSSSVSDSPYLFVKESLEIEDVEEVEPVQPNPPYLTSFFNNKKTPSQMTRRSRSTRNGGSSYGGDRGIKRISSFPAGALKFLMIKQKSRRRHSSGNEEEADEGKGEGYELCKKPILMGGRCRPMSFPCSPHNGIAIASNGDFPIRVVNLD